MPAADSLLLAVSSCLQGANSLAAPGHQTPAPGSPRLGVPRHEHPRAQDPATLGLRLRRSWNSDHGNSDLGAVRVFSNPSSRVPLCTSASGPADPRPRGPARWAPRRRLGRLRHDSRPRPSGPGHPSRSGSARAVARHWLCSTVTELDLKVPSHWQAAAASESAWPRSHGHCPSPSLRWNAGTATGMDSVTHCDMHWRRHCQCHGRPGTNQCAFGLSLSCRTASAEPRRSTVPGPGAVGRPGSEAESRTHGLPLRSRATQLEHSPAAAGEPASKT